jgi:hypothetical protein
MVCDLGVKGKKMKRYIALLISFILIGCTTQKDSTWYWQKIKESQAYANNPDNYKHVGGGLVACNAPDIMSSLYALEKRGEIIHLDLVFPNVPQSREVSKFWMNYCKQTPGIIEAWANPSYIEYKTQGVQPFHMQLWFKPENKEIIQKFIKEIEKFKNKKSL